MYWVLIKCCFRQQFQYKWNLIFQMAGDWLGIYIKICIWQAILNAGSIKNINFETLVSYSVIAALVSGLLYSRVAEELADRFRTGMIAIDFIRPISLKWYYFFGQLGENLYHVLFEGIFIAAVSFIIWKLPIPMPGTVLIFLVSLFLGLLIMFFIQYTIGLLVFWMKDGTYTRMIADGLFLLFSGIDIPLWFYPDWLKTLCDFLPFSYVAFKPISIWLGMQEAEQWQKVLLIQLSWVLILFMAERLIWKKIQSSVEIQGG